MLAKICSVWNEKVNFRFGSSPFSWNSAVGGSKNGRFLSTESDKVDDPFNVEEAETVHVPPPPSEKVLKLLLIK